MSLLIHVLYGITILVAAVYDYKTMQVKPWANIGIIALGLLENIWNIPLLLFEAIVIGLVFLCIAIKTDSIGGGDVKFIFANTLFLGFIKVYIGLLIGFGILSLQYLIRKIIFRKRYKKNKIPLLPYLVTGFLIVLFI